ncbi:MAG: DNA-directed RNA polymerase subunit L [DPANN group archaeon]|nr:DNA-directed RNA polymerase subunit L [DPANN group archaeon]
MAIDIEVLESTKKRLRIKVKGTGHTFCNVLVDELWNDDHVEVAAYSIKHPLVGVPELIIESKGKEPKKILQDGIKRLKHANDKAKKEFAKILK